MRSIRAAVLVLAGTYVVAACSLGVDRGGAIATDIRDQRSPVVTEVWYSGDDEASGPSMAIYMVEGVTEDEAVTVACEVVWPAIERGDPPNAFVFAIFAANRHDVLAQSSDPYRVDCP